MYSVDTLFLMCFHCLNWYHCASYSLFFSYSSWYVAHFYVKRVLLNFQKVVWFRVAWLTSQSSLFYFYKVFLNINSLELILIFLRFLAMALLFLLFLLSLSWSILSLLLGVQVRLYSGREPWLASCMSSLTPKCSSPFHRYWRPLPFICHWSKGTASQFQLLFSNQSFVLSSR